MSKHEIVTLSCKLLGIFFIANSLVYCITSISTIINLIQEYQFNFFAYTYVGPFLVYLIFGLVLWFYGSSVANIITKEMDTNAADKHTRVTADEAQSIGFSLIGLYILGGALPKLSSFFVALMLVPNTSFATISRGIEVIVQVVLGLFLLLGSQGLLGAIKALRYSGRPNKNGDSDPHE